MSFAYMPLFTGDYLRDTRHLTPLKHGVYLMALMHCWDSKGPMPLDEQECAGICNCRSADEIESLRYILGRFFVRMEDGHYNTRISEEVSKSERLSSVFRESGLKSAEVRRAKARAARSTKAEGRLKVGSTKAEGSLVSPSPSPSPPPTSSSALEAVTSVQPLLVPVKAERPSRKCPESFLVTVELQRWAKQEVPGVDIRAETAVFRDHTFKDSKSDWPGTWRNWMRRASSQSQPASAATAGTAVAAKNAKAKALLFGQPKEVFDV